MSEGESPRDAQRDGSSGIAATKMLTVNADEFGRAERWIAAASSSHGAHRRGHLDRLRHPRLPRAERGVDEEPRGREGGDAAALPRRPGGAPVAWQNRLHSPAWTAEPNSGHLAIYELERQGRLRAVVTQNIDELHQQAGHDPEKVIEVHGTMRWTSLLDVRRPPPDAARRSTGCVPARTTRRAWPAAAGVSEERHDLVRPGPGARGDRRGDARGRASATCCWPPARRCRCSRRPTSCRGPRRPAPGS